MATTDTRIKFTQAQKLTILAKRVLLFRGWIECNIDRVARIVRYGLRDWTPNDMDTFDFGIGEIERVKNKYSVDSSVCQLLGYLDIENKNMVVEMFCKDAEKDENEMKATIVSFMKFYSFLFNSSRWYEYLDIDPDSIHDKMNNHSFSAPHVYEKILADEGRVSDESKEKLCEDVNKAWNKNKK